MKHPWTLKLGATALAAIGALYALPACGDDCVDKQGPVNSCFPWPEADACPSDEQTILAEVRKVDPDHDYVSVPDPTGSRNSDNPPQCCYLVNMNYTDCGFTRVPGF